MFREQLDVMNFHIALDIPEAMTTTSPANPPEIRRPELRRKLILEESTELMNALTERNMIEVIDGMCDLIVVTYGTAVEMGIDLEPFWNEVHKSNMAKQGGPTREDGKKLKPEGWESPKLEAIYRKTYGEASNARG